MKNIKIFGLFMVLMLVLTSCGQKKSYEEIAEEELVEKYGQCEALAAEIIYDNQVYSNNNPGKLKGKDYKTFKTEDGAMQYWYKDNDTLFIYVTEKTKYPFKIKIRAVEKILPEGFDFDGKTPTYIYAPEPVYFTESWLRECDDRPYWVEEHKEFFEFDGKDTVTIFRKPIKENNNSFQVSLIRNEKTYFPDSDYPDLIDKLRKYICIINQ